MSVKRKVHEPTLIVELPLSTWRNIADCARYQAEKLSDWSIVNMLDDVFTEVDKK